MRRSRLLSKQRQYRSLSDVPILGTCRWNFERVEYGRYAMRVTVRGEVTLDQLQAELRHVCVELATCGVERIRGMNLYFTPLGHSGELEICTPDGSPVEIISIHPQRSSVTLLRKQGEYSPANSEDFHARLTGRPQATDD